MRYTETQDTRRPIVAGYMHIECLDCNKQVVVDTTDTPEEIRAMRCPHCGGK